MARVLKCDICGKCYPFPKDNNEINRISFKQVNYNPPHKENEYEFGYLDICPECIEAFVKLVEERKQKEE